MVGDIGFEGQPPIGAALERILTTLENAALPPSRRGKMYVCDEEWQKSSPVFQALFGKQRDANKVFYHILG